LEVEGWRWRVGGGGLEVEGWWWRVGGGGLVVRGRGELENADISVVHPCEVLAM
jgi:hypothetical protein